MRITCVQGDITTETTDAIVNAANSSLLGGGGVDGAIHRAAGPGLLSACRELRATSLPDGLPVGDAVATPGFDLPARWVIHTVGPVWYGGQRGEPERLAACYRNSLALAEAHRLADIAFPAISCGVYGYPPEAAAQIAVSELRRPRPPGSSLRRALLVAFSADMAEHYRRLL